MSWIQTFRGGQFFPMEPRHEDIDVRDIAHALSMQCRFAGHCLRFYSVAEHCVLMAQKVSALSKRWALLHDASEAYILDMPKPLKAKLGIYEAVEDRLMKKIAYRLNLGQMPDEVKVADMRILADERTQNMAACAHPWDHELKGVEPLGVELQYWSPERAEHEWLRALTEASIVEIRLRRKEKTA